MSYRQVTIDDQMEAQNEIILAHLEKFKTITQLEALKLYGCFRLGARIWVLRSRGHAIATEMVKEGRKRFAKYTMN